jgi:hypothetical protein
MLPLLFEYDIADPKLRVSNFLAWDCNFTGRNISPKMAQVWEWSPPKSVLKNLEYLIYKALCPINDIERLIHKLGQTTRI